MINRVYIYIYIRFVYIYTRIGCHWIVSISPSRTDATQRAQYNKSIGAIHICVTPCLLNTFFPLLYFNHFHCSKIPPPFSSKFKYKRLRKIFLSYSICTKSCDYNEISLFRYRSKIQTTRSPLAYRFLLTLSRSTLLSRVVTASYEFLHSSCKKKKRRSDRGRRILKWTNWAAQGGQSDRLVINSFRVSPRRRCDEKGGGSSSSPSFFLLCSRGIGGKSACLGGGGGGRSSHARVETISKRRGNPFALNEGGIRGNGAERSQLHGD